jgi:hypothetical protein
MQADYPRRRPERVNPHHLRSHITLTGDAVILLLFPFVFYGINYNVNGLRRRTFFVQAWKGNNGCIE